MTGPEHYREAERLIAAHTEALQFANANAPDGDSLRKAAPMADALLVSAQVHATLALAAATSFPAVVAYYGGDESDSREWARTVAS